MNALELKTRLKTWDNNKTLFKLTAISILITVVFFPINLLLNPNVDPIVYEYPFLLGFGFVAFVLMIMIAFAGGVTFTLMMLDSYLIFSPKVLDSIGKINSNTIWRDESFLNKMSFGIHTNVLKLSKKYNDPKIEELQQGSLRQQTEIDEIKQIFQNQINELEKWAQTEFDRVVQDFVRQIGILQLKLDKSERRRINAESELKRKNEELKIWRKVASDVSFRTLRQEKELDKFQTMLDEF